MTPQEAAARWPEHTKLQERNSSLSGFTAFLSWLENKKGLMLAKYDDAYAADLVKAFPAIYDLIAEFYGVDMEKFRRESTDMYQYLTNEITKPKED